MEGWECVPAPCPVSLVASSPVAATQVWPLCLDSFLGYNSLPFSLSLSLSLSHTHTHTHTHTHHFLAMLDLTDTTPQGAPVGGGLRQLRPPTPTHGCTDLLSPGHQCQAVIRPHQPS